MNNEKSLINFSKSCDGEEMQISLSCHSWPMKGKKSDRNKFTFSEIQSFSSSAGMKRKCKSPQGEATSLSTHDILLTRHIQTSAENI